MILLLLLIRAGHEGFEPTNAGVRVQCLTAWRVPINILYLENKMYYTLFYLICQGLFLIFSKKGLAALFSTAAGWRLRLRYPALSLDNLKSKVISSIANSLSITFAASALISSL